MDCAITSLGCPPFKRKDVGSNPSRSATIIIGASPSWSKAWDFDSRNPWFESRRACHCTKILLTSFNGRTLGCGPGDAVFDSPSQDHSSFPRGVKLKRTSAGLQNRKLQVRGLPPLPVLGSASVEILSATKNAAIKGEKSLSTR